MSAWARWCGRLAGAVALLLLWPLVAEPMLGTCPTSVRRSARTCRSRMRSPSSACSGSAGLSHAVGRIRVDGVLRGSGGGRVRCGAGRHQPPTHEKLASESWARQRHPLTWSRWGANRVRYQPCLRWLSSRRRSAAAAVRPQSKPQPALPARGLRRRGRIRGDAGPAGQAPTR